MADEASLHERCTQRPRIGARSLVAIGPVGPVSIWRMAHTTPRRTNDASQAYAALIVQSQALLRRNPRRTVRSVAHELSVSERTLNRVYRERANSTLREQRSRMRLDAAAAALLDGRTHRQAAWCAGFTHARHLVSPFRAYFGITPAQMRRAGRAIRTLRWQARQPAPLRGSYQSHHRAPTWRAERRVLREINRLLPDCPARRRVQRALGLSLKRPVRPTRPLTPQEAWGPLAEWFPHVSISDAVRAA